MESLNRYITIVCIAVMIIAVLTTYSLVGLRKRIEKLEAERDIGSMYEPNAGVILQTDSLRVRYKRIFGTFPEEEHLGWFKKDTSCFGTDVWMSTKPTVYGEYVLSGGQTIIVTQK